jgi:hypothetical protein
LISKTKSTASSFNVGGGNGTPRMGKRQIKPEFKPRGTKLKLEEQSKYNDLFLKQERQLEDDRFRLCKMATRKNYLLKTNATKK